MTASRRPAGPALAALALGTFGLGTTEFAVVGLLPNIAESFGSSSQAIGAAIAAYAFGAMLGAPVLTLLLRRLPLKRVLIVEVVLLAIATLITALSPNLEVFILARFLSGLPHGAYFGAAAATAMTLLAPQHRGRAASTVVLGQTIANIAGVPLATALGDTAGWSAVFLGITAIFTATAIAITVLLPQAQPREAGPVTADLAALKRGQMWIGIIAGAIGFASINSVYGYISVIAAAAGLTTSATPWILVLFGVGMTVGAVIGGRIADRSVKGALVIAYAVTGVVMVVFALTMSSEVFVFIAAFGIGISAQLIILPLQIRLIDTAPFAPAFAAALTQSAVGLANVLGSTVGGALLIFGPPYTLNAWAAAAFAATALILISIAKPVRTIDREYRVSVATGSIAIVPQPRKAWPAPRPTASEPSATE
ncbi:MFS transporter [Microbacterium oleivorans]|uniref:MFS transporter n=1 Tax=Microbacterium oleivorans TaxID=273677 RepID=A0A7D5EWM1_9MICO|nr:MFS transporter [Microbacterium oleivorans]QLD12752.1 MFS transporter [Microbacterium oleivorans]